MARKNDMTDMQNMIDIMCDAKVLRGKRISVTGHLGVKRAAFADFIVRHGGEFQASPNYNTTILVTNQDWTAKTVNDGASHKLIKAQLDGVTIMHEKGFYALVAELAEKAQNTQ